MFVWWKDLKWDRDSTKLSLIFSTNWLVSTTSLLLRMATTAPLPQRGTTYRSRRLQGQEPLPPSSPPGRVVGSIAHSPLMAPPSLSDNERERFWSCWSIDVSLFLDFCPRAFCSSRPFFFKAASFLNCLSALPYSMFYHFCAFSALVLPTFAFKSTAPLFLLCWVACGSICHRDHCWTNYLWTA